MANRFADIYQRKGLLNALAGIDQPEDTPINLDNVQSVEQLQAMMRPTESQRKQAFFQGLYDLGTALQNRQGLGAGLMAMGNRMQEAKQSVNPEFARQLETRNALKKLMEPTLKKAPTTRTIGRMVDGRPFDVNQEFDPYTGQWTDVGQKELRDWNAPKQMDDITRQINELRMQDLQSQIDARNAKAEAPKSTPAWLGKIQNEELENIGLSSTIEADLAKTVQQLEQGKIPLGPVENVISRGKNWAGVSDEGSRQFATLKATIEKMRNDSLRLNKGVQTEGDAQRAFNEILDNLNDPELVKQRLKEIADINRRGAGMKIAQINQMRMSSGLQPLSDAELQQFTQQASPLFNSSDTSDDDLINKYLD